ncbi:MAG: hypothetical protein ACE5F7_02550 [Nitrospiria bacterium]
MSKSVLTFFLTAIYLLTPALAAHAEKPLPPVQIGFQQNDLSEDETEITLSARVFSDTELLTLVIDLPLEVFLIEGELAWEGPLRAGAEQHIKIKVINSGGLHTEIQGLAEVRLKDGTMFVQKSLFVMSALSEGTVKPVPPLRHKGNGGTTLEFRGE